MDVSKRTVVRRMGSSFYSLKASSGAQYLISISFYHGYKTFGHVLSYYYRGFLMTNDSFIQTYLSHEKQSMAATLTSNFFLSDIVKYSVNVTALYSSQIENILSIFKTNEDLPEERTSNRCVPPDHIICLPVFSYQVSGNIL